MSSTAGKLRLYRDIRRLHRQLPPDLRLLGNKYIKDEWDRHRKADAPFVTMFIREWQLYREMLAGQVVDSVVMANPSEPKVDFGKHLNKDQLDALRDDQIGQLFALKTEVFKEDELEKKI
ncbi:acetate non-utilizing protein 9 [Dinochytrium kinnereticum]|nr:acetate non-utilizing protein 9 [Dinochytrium kinnereticum]